MTEALEEAIDLLNSALMFRVKYREEVPKPSRRRKGELLIAPDADVALKIALYISMRKYGIKTAELSRRLNVDYREAQRIVNPRHATKTGRMVKAIKAAGGRAVIDLRSA